MTFLNKSLISINDYSKEDYLKVLEVASEFERNPRSDLLKNYIISTLFFEPSTRTRLSFESAILQLGGRIIGFSDANSSSTKKGESLYDTIKTVTSYCDLIVMRHNKDGSSRHASLVSSVPVINAGDGANQHPTQTLLDLYSIKKTQGRLDNLKIAFIGDLKYGRTVHSLVRALMVFENMTFYFISPEQLKMIPSITYDLDEKKIDYVELESFKEIIDEVDIIYMTRIQKERFQDEMEYEKVKNFFVLNKKHLVSVKKNLKVLHPLPRVNEISKSVDDTPYAYYFEQAKNGVYTRQAIVSLILGVRD